MNETKFTKGGWVARTEKFGGMQIGLVYVNGGGFNVSDAPDAIANAHLIAAAPEMYAMLEMGLSEMHGLINEVNDQRMSRIHSQMQTPPDLHDGQTLHEIQMLLAKARGEL